MRLSVGSSWRVSLFFVAGVCHGASQAQGLGSVIAFGDEWVFSDAAFAANPSETNTFVQNVVDYFTDDAGSGNFLILSNNGVAYGDSFVMALEGTGSTVTVNPGGFAINPTNLAPFDGVFFAGTMGSGAPNANGIEQYVLGGGSVFVQAGTGNFGSAAGEANAWNPLLNRFGLAFGNTWFGTASVSGPTDPVPLLPSDSPLRDTLSELEWGFGQEVIDLDLDDDANRIDLTGNFQAFNSPPPGDTLNIAGTFNVPIPTPGSICIVAAAGLFSVTRRR